MNFSVTERGTAKRCRRKAVLTSRNGQHLTPIFPTMSLATGTIVHRGHQLWLDEKHATLRDSTFVAADEQISKAEDTYKKKVGCDPSADETAPLYEAMDFCLSMAHNYTQRYDGRKLPDEYELISTEQKVEIPVPGTEHTCEKCDGSGEVWVKQEKLSEDVRLLNPQISEVEKKEPCLACAGTGVALHVLEGRFDGLIRLRGTNVVGILERKTYKQRPRLEVLMRVDQFKSYAWMLQQLKISDQPPFMLYDGLWRRHAPPKGRTFDELFAQYKISWSPQALAQYDKYLPSELNDMADMYADADKQYPHIPWQGCHDCNVTEICDRMSEGRSYDDLIASKFTERTDDTADIPELEEVA